MIMEAVNTPEISAYVNETTLCSIREGCDLNTHHHQNLKSHGYIKKMVMLCLLLQFQFGGISESRWSATSCITL